MNEISENMPVQNPQTSSGAKSAHASGSPDKPAGAVKPFEDILNEVESGKNRQTKRDSEPDDNASKYGLISDSSSITQVTSEYGNKEISNPVSDGSQTGFDKQTGLIGSGGKLSPSKEFPDASAPPGKPNAPPGDQAQSEMAGPRGETADTNQPIRITEEAIDPKTQRAVSEQSTRNPNLQREFFRMPANEITAGNANHPTNAVNTAKISVDSAGISEKTPVVFAGVHKPSNETAQREPVQFKQNSDSQVQNQNDNSKADAGKQTRNDSGNEGSQKNAKGESQIPLDVKVLNQSSGNGFKAAMNVTDSSTIAKTPDSAALGTQVVQNNTVETAKILEIKEPVSVLNDAPSRIAGEVNRAVSEGLADDGKAILRVELKPPRLGRMNIEIQKSSEGMEVRLVVRTSFARELVQQRGEEIRTALQEMGINVKKFEIIDLNNQRQDSGKDISQGFMQDNDYQRGGNESERSGANHQDIINGEDENQIAPDVSRTDSNRSITNTSTRLNILA